MAAIDLKRLIGRRATASGNLLQDSFTGVGDHTVTISENKVVAYMKYELTEVVVSNDSVSGGGDSQPEESFRMNYTKITVTTYEVKDGTATK